MTLYPNRPDTNRPDTNRTDMDRTDMNRPYTNRPNAVKTQESNNMPWGWIGGVGAALILGFIVWSVMDDGTSTTATNKAPAMTERAPATTGSGSGSSSGATTGSATTGSASTGSAPSAPPNPETKGAAQ